MGEGKLTPLTTPTPLNRQSPNIAHVITSTISPHMPQLVKIVPGVTSPHIAKVTTQTTQFLYFFVLCTQNLYTESSGRLTDFDKRYTNRRVFMQGSAFRGLEHSILTSSPSKPPKTLFLAHTMESLREIHIRITAWCIEIRCWNLASCFILPSTLSTHKRFSVQHTAGG